jgi:hypothetical protein
MTFLLKKLMRIREKNSLGQWVNAIDTFFRVELIFIRKTFDQGSNWNTFLRRILFKHAYELWISQEVSISHDVLGQEASETHAHEKEVWIGERLAPTLMLYTESHSHLLVFFWPSYVSVSEGDSSRHFAIYFNSYQ